MDGQGCVVEDARCGVVGGEVGVWDRGRGVASGACGDSGVGGGRCPVHGASMGCHAVDCSTDHVFMCVIVGRGVSGCSVCSLARECLERARREVAAPAKWPVQWVLATR